MCPLDNWYKYTHILDLSTVYHALSNYVLDSLSRNNLPKSRPSLAVEGANATAVYVD